VPALSHGAPIALIVPGLTGNSQSGYVRHLVLALAQRGFRGIVLNYRGYGMGLKTPLVTCSALVQDIQDAVQFVRSQYPQAKIYACGFSMGANSLVKLLGQNGMFGINPGISAAVSVSNPFNFLKLSHNLRLRVNELLYSRFLAWRLKREILLKET
jgi:abhydrolase domain-containing protein 1/3